MAGSVVIRELLTVYGFDAQGEKEINQLDKNINTLKRTAMMAGAAIAGLGAAAFALAKSTATAGDRAQKTAQRVGMSAEAWQEYEHAASLADVSNSQLENSMGRLARNANDMANGTGEAQDAFNELGVDVTDANGELKDSARLNEELATALSQIESETKRAALASEIYGRSGRKLMPMLNKGAEGIQQMRQEARELGVVMSNETAQASAAFNDGMHRMWQILRGIRNAFGARLIPMFNDVWKGVEQWYRQNQKVIDQSFDEVIEGMATGLQWLIDSGKSVAETINTIVQWFGGWEDAIRLVGLALATLGVHQAINAMTALIKVVQGAIAAYRTMGTAAALAQAKAMLIPIAIAALIVALGLVIEDFQRFFAGQNSAIGKLVEKYPKLGHAIYAIRDAFDDASDVGADFLAWLLGAPGEGQSVFTRMGEAIGDVWYNLFENIDRWWGEKVEKFDEWVRDIKKLGGFLGIGNGGAGGPGGASGPVGASRTGAQLARSRQRIVNNGGGAYQEGDMNVRLVQQSGENNEQFRRRLVRTIREERDRERRQTQQNVAGGVRR